jgi:hypothetical protein
LQDPSVLNEDNLSNVRRETSRHFRNKKREYLKEKINEFELNSNNKNITYLYRGVIEFKKGYQPKTNLVKDERGDLLADPQQILIGWTNYFCQQLNVQGVVGSRQSEIQTAEPFVPEPSAAEVDVAIRKLKMYEVPGSNQNPPHQNQPGGGGILAF